MKSGNSNLVPEARDALNRFKMEAAREEEVRSDIKKHKRRGLESIAAAHPGRLFFDISEGLRTDRQHDP